MVTKYAKVIRLLTATNQELLREQFAPVVFPMVVANYAARFASEKIRQALTDGNRLSELLYHCYRVFDYDLIMVFTDVMVEAEAMGCEIEIPEDEPPVLLQPAREKSRPFTTGREKRLGIVLQATRRLREMVKDETFILVSLKGPFSLACFLAGPEHLLELLLASPEKTDWYLQCALSNQKHYAREIIRAGGIPFIGDPFASGSIISPTHFQRFALPYLKELVDFIHQLGSWTGLHICGDSRQILQLMNQTGAEVLSVDEMPLKSVRTQIGPQSIIMGNVSTQLLETGKPQQVANAAQDCLNSGMPKMILSSACDLATSTPKENVVALIETARSWRWK